MSAASSQLSEDQFLCSICLDVFTDPVSTPCGHNFCNNCITEHWDRKVSCKCPYCKKVFSTRPELQVNTFISEMVSLFRQSAQQRASSSSEQQAAKPGEVPCDVCAGTKLKALKSCLVCLVSYCETHLEPHLTASGLKRHRLIDPVKNLEGRMCATHDKLLELFCKDDQSCVCMLCAVLDHKAHDVVPLKEEYEGRKAELGKTEAELQQMIQQRQDKIQEIKDSAKLSRENANRETAGIIRVFIRLKDEVEKGQAKVIQMIEEQQITIEKQAEDFIKGLEQEISELKKKSAELEQLSLSEDHLNLLQNFTTLNAAPPTRDWTEATINPTSCDSTVMRAICLLLKTLKQLYTNAEFKTAQQFAVNVTLDPDTAHPGLLISEDGKQVYHNDGRRNLTENPERFLNGLCVLAKQFISSRRFYFEVQVKGKTEWVLGVASESVSRRGQMTIRTQNGYWTVGLKNENELLALTYPPVRLLLKSKPEKVGVFVDYEEGLVSFYDVDAAHLIYAFTGCSFTGKIFPLLCPCINKGSENCNPLIICPVNPRK